jgi:hypothetical protein
MKGHEWRRVFEQIPLLAHEAGGGGRGREGPYDNAVLRYCGYYRLVTSHQAVYRFWVFRGLNWRRGFHAIRRLEQGGMLERFPLEPHRGRASRDVLRLTRKGFLHIGVTPPDDVDVAIDPRTLHYRLQFTEALLLRELEGFTWVTNSVAAASLREGAKALLRGRALDAVQAAAREQLDRLDLRGLRLHALRHRQTSEVRLIVPVRDIAAVQRAIVALPTNLSGLMMPVHFELIGADQDKLETVKGRLERWGREHRVDTVTHQTELFTARPHPMRADGERADRYAAAGLPNPDQLI